MKIRELSQQESAGNGGYTHAAEVSYLDLVALGAVASGVVPLLTDLAAGDIIKDADFQLLTPFDGGATSALALNVGINGASVDDDDALIAAREVHADASNVKAGDGNGAAFATLRTGWAMTEAGQVEAKFTATGGNLNALTAGLVLILFCKVKMGRLRV